MAKAHSQHRIIRRPEGITFAGIDHGAAAEVVKETPDFLVVKFPSGSHWNGRGCARAYHPARIYVLKKLIQSDRVEEIIDWDVTRQHKR